MLERRFGGLRYAAALVGSGSEVLGYDDEESTDHHWGPRVTIFLSPPDHARSGDEVSTVLERELPHEFRGWSTSFGPPDEVGVRLLEPVSDGRVNHRVDVETVSGFMRAQLGFDPLAGVTLTEWLTTPQQSLLNVTAGAVFHDELGELTAAREAVAFYPHDVWLYLMAARWKRVGDLEAFVGRCGALGDDLGSRLVAATIAGELIRLAFLLERRYAPYAKWLGTAFRTLGIEPRLRPLLEAAMSAEDWKAREESLSSAYATLAERHNALALTPPLPTEVEQFHGRPYLVIPAEKFAAALRDAIEDPELRQIPLDLERTVDS